MESISDGELYFFLLHVATDFKYVSSSPHNILYCSNGLFDRHAPGRFATFASGLVVSYRVVTQSSACGSSPAAGCQQRGTVEWNQTHKMARQSNKQLLSLLLHLKNLTSCFKKKIPSPSTDHNSSTWQFIFSNWQKLCTTWLFSVSSSMKTDGDASFLSCRSSAISHRWHNLKSTSSKQTNRGRC